MWLWAMLVGTALFSGASAQETKKERPANLGGTGEGGAAITGLVKFTGEKPPRRTLEVMLGNAYCKEHCQGVAPVDERWVFGKNGDQDTLQNVFVYVSKGLEGKKFEVPKDPAVLDQVGCRYTPRVLGLMTGQTLEIRNSDGTLHNVMGNFRLNKAFNEGMSVKGGKLEKVFPNRELRVDVRCFMHTWMVAWVHILDHPFFAVTGADGTFTLRGLPAGEYEISAIHEAGSFVCDPGSVHVTLAEGKTQKIEFTYHRQQD
jgi:hypothetical protein